MMNSKVYMTTHPGGAEVKNIQLKDKYPILEDNISASEVITPQGSEILIYDTVTQAKNYANKATFNFLTLATGMKTFEEIKEELSQQSGELPELIWPGLTTLAKKMIADKMLKISESPFKYQRTPPPSVTLVHRLEYVTFETTRKCNLKCRHCYSASGPPRESELTVEEIKGLIDHLSEMGVLAIVFSGGEPLMHPHLFELMEYARKKPLTVSIFTNGTLITEEVIQKLKELEVQRVNVSIDGPDSETHDEFRGVAGAFEKTIRGVNALVKAGITVDASICINKFNHKKIKQILQLMRDLRVNDFKIWPIRFSGRAAEKDLFVTPEEFRTVMEAVREFEFEELGKTGKEEYKYSKRLENCGIGSNRLVIKSNGVVTPCLSLEEDVSLGNIREQSVADIWNNSELLNRLRVMSVYETEICRDCELAAVCKGGCIAEIYRETGTFSCYDKYDCVAFEVTKNDYIYVEEDDSRSRFLSME